MVLNLKKSLFDGNWLAGKIAMIFALEGIFLWIFHNLLVLDYGVTYFNDIQYLFQKFVFVNSQLNFL